MAFIGYTRVSMREQNVTGQWHNLQAAGCGRFFAKKNQWAAWRLSGCSTGT